MPTATCTGCGRQTNTSVSESRCGVVIYCFAAFDNGSWKKGCGFDKGVCPETELAEELIKYHEGVYGNLRLIGEIKN